MRTRPRSTRSKNKFSSGWPRQKHTSQHMVNSLLSRRNQVRRVQRPIVVVLTVVIVIVSLTGSFLLGRFVRLPDSVSIRAAQTPIAVWEPAVERAVDSRMTFAGTTSSGDISTITPLSPSAPAVVVRQGVNGGDVLRPGAFIGVGSGVPYWILDGPLPLYRDLNVGDSGDDVTAFQKSLVASGIQVRLPGEVDSGTVAAIRRLFTAQRLTPPSAPIISASQFLTAPAATATVVERAEVSARLGDTTPLLKLRTGLPSVSFRVDTVTAQELKVDQTVSVNMSSGTVQAKIVTVGTFELGTGTQTPGHAMTAVCEDPACAGLTDGSAVTVLGPGSAEKSLAVPLIALREDAQGAYVLRRDETGKSAEGARIAVTVIHSGEGWVAVASTNLKPGDQVKVA